MNDQIRRIRSRGAEPTVSDASDLVGLEEDTVPVTAPRAGSDGSLPRGVSERAAANFRRAMASGEFTRRLSAKPIPGFRCRWVNDQDGRIEQFTGIGWDYVQQGEQGVENKSTDAGNHVSRVVGSLPSGEPLRAYLLKIPEDWYSQFQKMEQQQVDKVDETIRRGGVGLKPGDKRYAPSEGIKISDSVR